MAPPTILLLSSFFLSLLLLIVFPSHCILDPTSATLAINQATGTVCGITAGTQHHGIQCTTVEGSARLNTSFLIDPTLSFDSITGGRNFICSLRSGDASFCWDGINPQVKHVHSGPTVLTELSVGAEHVATIEGDPTKMQTIRWWRYGCHSRSRPRPDFPKSIDGVFHSITSGDVFTCAIDETHKVNCWGPHAKLIMMRFAGVYMRSVTAGGSRMCGLNMTGHLICSEDQLNVPYGETFEFTSIAIGSSHTCAIRQKYGTVVCWDQYGSYSPVGSTSFEFLVAGGNLTCGLTTDALNVVCWGLNWRNLSAITLSLPKILPGVCMPDEIFCSCGVYPDSGTLCGGSGVICKRSDTNTTKSCRFLFRIERSWVSSLRTWEWLGKWWYLLVIGGAAFAIVVIIFVLYKKFSTSTANRLVQHSGPILPDMENLEVFSFNDLKTATDKFSWCARFHEGRYGTVYKGRLSDGRQVAVKYCTAMLGSEFDSELSKLAVVHHDNVVSLIGYCRENNNRLFVFDLMRNKDLHANLHPKFWCRKSLLYFSWKVRVRVLLDAARGINYLHQEANPRIIHQDIKSSNIVIDENWGAKISGFGFALFGPEEGMQHVDVARVNGTLGYADPEYVNTRRVTPRSDVYSFGVVIFEVLTGRKVNNSSTASYLANEVAPIVAAGNIQEVLDRRLPLPARHQMVAIHMVAQLANSCIAESYLLRPFMSVVVSELQSAFVLFDKPEASINH